MEKLQFCSTTKNSKILEKFSGAHNAEFEQATDRFAQAWKESSNQSLKLAAEDMPEKLEEAIQRSFLTSKQFFDSARDEIDFLGEAAIERLQSGINSSVASIQQGNKQIEQTVANVDKAMSSFNSIRTEIKSINEMMNHIAISTDEQSTVINHINQSLSDIDRKANTTNDNSQNMNKEVKEVVQSADNLSDVVARFKL